MKKLVVLSMLALGMMMLSVGATPAHAICIHFTNFCDSIQAAGDTNEPGELYGEWDWVCVGVGTSIYGSNSKKITLATRPVYGTYTSVYTFGFVFTKSSKLFDLAATTGTSTLLFQQGQPWTNTGGSCGFAGPHTRLSGRSTTGK